MQRIFFAEKAKKTKNSLFAAKYRWYHTAFKILVISTFIDQVTLNLHIFRFEMKLIHIALVVHMHAEDLAELAYFTQSSYF